jgi:hypothetical protein
MSAPFLKVPRHGDVERLEEVNRYPLNRVNLINYSHRMLLQTSTRGVEPRGRVNFLCPTSNTVPSPLLSLGEACSTKIMQDMASP